MITTTARATTASTTTAFQSDTGRCRAIVRTPPDLGSRPLPLLLRQTQRKLRSELKDFRHRSPFESNPALPRGSAARWFQIAAYLLQTFARHVCPACVTLAFLAFSTVLALLKTRNLRLFRPQARFEFHLPHQSFRPGNFVPSERSESRDLFTCFPFVSVCNALEFERESCRLETPRPLPFSFFCPAAEDSSRAPRADTLELARQP